MRGCRPQSTTRVAQLRVDGLETRHQAGNLLGGLALAAVGYPLTEPAQAAAVLVGERALPEVPPAVAASVTERAPIDWATPTQPRLFGTESGLGSAGRSSTLLTSHPWSASPPLDPTWGDDAPNALAAAASAQAPTTLGGTGSAGSGPAERSVVFALMAPLPNRKRVTHEQPTAAKSGTNSPFLHSTGLGAGQVRD